ncbi:MAG TPA: hypothetical protein VGH90_02115 [Chthoniobacteraceae bacterium]
MSFPELPLRRILLRLGYSLVLLFSAADSTAFADAFSNQVVAAQQEAVRKYPDLGKAGTPFNKAFVAEVGRLKTQNPAFFSQPRWPVMLADKIAVQSMVVGNLVTGLWRLGFVILVFVVALTLSAVIFAKETASFGKAALLAFLGLVVELSYFVVLGFLFVAVFGREKSSSMLVCSFALWGLTRLVWIMLVSRTFQVSGGRAVSINIVANLICYAAFALCGFETHWSPAIQIDQALSAFSRTA